jgi:ABC-2 type transport system permease protein
MIAAIARRELRGYLHAPFSYVVSAAFLFIAGVFWALVLDSYAQIAGQAEMYGMDDFGMLEGVIQPFVSTIGLLLVLFMPVVTMRVLSDEQGGGAMALLLSSPVTSAQVVIGKWLGLWAFFLGLLGVGLLYVPATLFFFGEPPVMPLLTATLGVVLLTGLGSALGVMAASLASSQILAAVVSWAGLMALWILSFLATSDGRLQPVGAMIGLMNHMEAFGQGMVRSNDLIWFGTLIALFLFVAQQRVESHRWR